MDYKTSTGEEVLEEFFNEKGIVFKREVKIHKLKGDYADYRVADFYLPRYKVYIEFFGRWDLEDTKQKYKKKKELYKDNNIPCIYLYPDNLGALDIILRRRLRDSFTEHPELKLQKFLFNFDLLIEQNFIGIVLIVALIYFVDNLVLRIIFVIFLISLGYNAINSTFFRK